MFWLLAGSSGIAAVPPSEYVVLSAIAVRAMNDGAVRPAATSNAPRPRRFLLVIGISVPPALRELVVRQRHNDVQHAAHLLLNAEIVSNDGEGVVRVQELNQLVSSFRCGRAIDQQSEVVV